MTQFDDKRLVAEVKGTDVRNGRNFAGEKATVGGYTVVAYRKGRFYEPVRVRFYEAKNAKGGGAVYATVWASNGDKVSVSGSGNASGYGYDKASAAMDTALKNAGITLRGDLYGKDTSRAAKRKTAHIDGTGTAGIEAALCAVARAMGYRKFHLANF